MTLILNHQDIQHRIRRIAYQIYETHLHETEIILAGIQGNGYVFAEKIRQCLTEISPLKITLCKVNMDKKIR